MGKSVTSVRANSLSTSESLCSIDTAADPPSQTLAVQAQMLPHVSQWSLPVHASCAR